MCGKSKMPAYLFNSQEVQKRNDLKELVKKIPIIGGLARSIYRTCINQPKPFPGSMEYWEQRYHLGGNSGPGSYNALAEYKAEVLNSFVKNNNIITVIEYGCGDGNQLTMAEYPTYIGFDVSPEAIARCNKNFAGDKTKAFKLMHEYAYEIAQLTLSLDVVYHLIEDNVFVDYMKRLFSSSNQFVIIYSSNNDDNRDNHAPQIKHRKFSDWIEKTQPQWKLLRHIPNRYPYTGDFVKGSFADFYIYERAVGCHIVKCL